MLLNWFTKDCHLYYYRKRYVALWFISLIWKLWNRCWAETLIPTKVMILHCLVWLCLTYTILHILKCCVHWILCYRALKGAARFHYSTLCHISVFIVIAHIACFLQSPCLFLMFELYKWFMETSSENKVILCWYIITVNLSHSPSGTMRFCALQLFSMSSCYQCCCLGCWNGFMLKC